MSVQTAFLFRSYVKTSSDEAINTVLERAEKSRDAVMSLGADYEPVFLVPGSDFGGTYEILYDRFKGSVRVFRSDGDANSTALNSAMKTLRYLGFTRVAITSNKAVPFITRQLIDKVEMLFRMECLAVGVVIPELADFVMSGRIQNTLAFWSLETVLELNPQGFDSKIGVEEIAVLIRMYREYGPCVGIVNPVLDDRISLDVRASDEARAHHELVMRTKMERHLKEARRVGGNLDDIQKAILRVL